jgi:nitrate/nitrite transporter NarK
MSRQAAVGRPWRPARAGVALALAMACGNAGAAVNSYRFLHVTIDTPWHIFLFLLMGVFAPFVLMAVLMWRYSARRRTPPARPAPPEAPPPAAKT